MSDDRTPARRVDAITEYLQQMPTGSGEVHMHVHHHYPAPAQDLRPVDQNPGQNVLERYTPYFLVLLGGMVIITGCAVIAYMIIGALVPLLAITTVMVLAMGVAARMVLGQVAPQKTKEKGRK